MSPSDLDDPISLPRLCVVRKFFPAGVYYLTEVKPEVGHMWSTDVDQAKRFGSLVEAHGFCTGDNITLEFVGSV